eukprot:TRINITY_DN4999_c0_g1_i1.p1 TRINITY_DN4999_c0_g1~~TRINITY_DN4999_c0_g1_i1.p1  ORF type:complete len:418 (+),score=95.12 TRINITY_DN4999_c0_g1_i1:178-1431(+)
MRCLSIAVVLASLTTAALGSNWAVLVAGSNTFSNYRHQADVCHAYHVLLEHGFLPEHIIVMMYDDIANNPDNPHPGVIINHPDGPNVYQGVKIDYRQDDVSPDNFINIIEGNAQVMRGVGTGRVLASKEADNVFINFVDHGGPGVVAFPQDLLNSSRLEAAFVTMHKRRMYKQMLFYLEACESGSMFDHDFLKPLRIFATTAANASQSSFACYYDKDLQTYLGDLYSVNWMQNSDLVDLAIETLEEQYLFVAAATNTSQVCKFGDETFRKEPAGRFLAGPKNSSIGISEPAPAPRDLIDSRMVDEDLLRRKVASASTPEQRRAAQLALEKHLDAKAQFIGQVSVVSRQLLAFNLASQVGQRQQRACQEQAMHAVHRHCLNLGQNSWAFAHVKPLVSSCQHGVDGAYIVDAVKQACMM